MTKLTDLEICMRIAEIDKIPHYLQEGMNDIFVNTSAIYGDVCEFNPLTDDALCFQLMVKYDIQLTSMEPTLKDGSDGYEYTCYKQGAYRNVSAILSIDRSPNKAICLAIIEAHKND